MTFYVQLTEESKVTDIITYPYADYTEVELPTPLPPASYSGIYRLHENQLEYVPEWDTDGILTAQESDDNSK